MFRSGVHTATPNAPLYRQCSTVLLRVVVCVVLTTLAWVIDDFRVRALFVCVVVCVVVYCMGVY